MVKINEEKKDVKQNKKNRLDAGIKNVATEPKIRFVGNLKREKEILKVKERS